MIAERGFFGCSRSSSSLVAAVLQVDPRGVRAGLLAAAGVSGPADTIRG